jgi:anti-anti-sigma factor
MTSTPFRHRTNLVSQPRCRSLVDCAGAALHVHTRSVATVISVEGEIDASNAERVQQAIRRYARLKAPLIVDLSALDFIGLAGLQALTTLDREHERAGLHWHVVDGPRLCRLTRVITDHGLPLIDSVAEALRIIGDQIATRRQCLAVPACQHEPQWTNSAVRRAPRRATA